MSASDDSDLVGEQGEDVFRTAITKWCGGEPWFRVVHQGEKAEALDFQVTLRESTVFHAIFFVQVKATAKAKRYEGTGNSRQLLVRLKAKDAKKLGKMAIPVFVVGIDVISGAAYYRHIPGGRQRDLRVCRSGDGWGAQRYGRSGKRLRSSGTLGQKACPTRAFEEAFDEH